MTPKVTIQEIVNGVDALPEMPQVAMRVSQMMEDPNVSADQIGEVIKVDPGMTSQILKLCNSAAYRLKRQVSIIKEAVAILGFKALKSMVYTIISKVALDRPVSGYSLDEGDLWYNSLTCAVYARHIAQRERFVDPELAFTAGLLRDIGKIVLGQHVGANYPEIEQLAVSQQLNFHEAEEQVLGFSHSMVGQRVAEKWKLPDTIVKVIRYHHKPIAFPEGLDSKERTLITIVHLADVFTMMVGRGMGSDGMMYSLDMEALAAVGIDTSGEHLEVLLGELVELNSTVKGLADSFVAENV